MWVNVNLLICRCDVVRGSLGVGIYVRIKLKGFGKDCVIVGVFLGFGIVKFFDGKKYFNFVIKLIMLKVR